MSVQRSFAQRNNNVVNLVPEMATSGYWYETYLLNIDPRNGSVFNVDLIPLTLTRTNLTVTNQVDVEGYLNSTSIDGIEFAIIVDPTIAKTYPGLEFTVNFINTDYNLEDNNTFVSVCPDATLTGEGDEYYIHSPLYGFDWSTTQSLTFKSNGSKFTVISSGPTSWFKWC